MVAFALQVNECRIFGSNHAALEWVNYRLMGPEHRFEVVNSTIGGEVVNVVCDDEEHAKRLMSHMIEKGVPKCALKIVRKNIVKL